MDDRFLELTNIPQREKLFRFIIHERASGICALCGRQVEFSDMDTDHKTPRSKGGADHADNIQCTHFQCNVSKSANEVETVRELDLKPRNFKPKFSVHQYGPVPSNADISELVTIGQAARMKGITRQAIHMAIESGHIAVVGIMWDSRMLSRKSVEAFTPRAKNGTSEKERLTAMRDRLTRKIEGLP